MNIRQAVLEDVQAIKEIEDLLYLDIPGFDWNKEDFIGDQIKRGEYYVAEAGEYSGHKFYRLEFSLI